MQNFHRPFMLVNIATDTTWTGTGRITEKPTIILSPSGDGPSPNEKLRRWPPLDYPVYLGPPNHDYLGDGEKILTGPQKGDTINTTAKISRR